MHIVYTILHTHAYTTMPYTNAPLTPLTNYTHLINTSYKHILYTLYTLYIDNVGHLLPPHNLVYIATDERNTTFFDAFHEKYNGKVRYLDDYFELAGLASVNPNYLGMLFDVCMKYHICHCWPVYST